MGCKIGEVIFVGGYPVKIGGYVLVGLMGVEFQDTSHLYLEQAFDILYGNFAYHLGFPWFQTQVYMVYRLFLACAFLEFLVFVYALFDEYAFQ